MLSIYSLKASFQRLLTPLVELLFRAGITANQVTISTCAASVAMGAILCFSQRRWFLSLPFFLIARMAMNAADGMLARGFGQQSTLGVYLNELGDVVADSCLYLPFAFVAGFSPIWIGAVIVLSILSEMTGVVAALTGASRRYDGPMGKSDRAAVFGLLALWVGLDLAISPGVSYYIPVVLSFALGVTIFNRVRGGLLEVARGKIGTQTG